MTNLSAALFTAHIRFLGLGIGTVQEIFSLEKHLQEMFCKTDAQKKQAELVLNKNNF